MKHIAIIMDGNGRWAKARGLARSEGHKAGAEVVRSIFEYAKEINLPYLTLYALSRENLSRPADEVNQLFSLLAKFISGELDNLIKQDIRLHVIGDIKSLPLVTQKSLNYALEKTKDCKSLNVALALAYSGREEIARAFMRMYENEDVASLAKAKDASSIIAEKIKSYLDAPSFPEPDLIIRTGGNIRISNFLLYQAAYSEFYFTDLFFPDFTKDEFQKAIDEFSKTTRRFGKTDEQIAQS